MNLLKKRKNLCFYKIKIGYVKMSIQQPKKKIDTFLADKIKEKIDLPVNLKIRATLIHNDITEEEEKETFELINILR